MPSRERVRLTDAAIARLRPHEREYTVWDSRVIGLGVRVRPSGGRSYVLLQKTGGRSRRVSLGPVATKDIAEIRRECHARQADPDWAAVAAHAAPLFRGFVAGEWKAARFEPLQAVDAKKRAVRTRGPAAAGFRDEAPRPHHTCPRQALIR